YAAPCHRRKRSGGSQLGSTSRHLRGSPRYETGSLRDRGVSPAVAQTPARHVKRSPRRGAATHRRRDPRAAYLSSPPIQIARSGARSPPRIVTTSPGTASRCVGGGV